MARTVQANCTVRMMAAVRQRANMNTLQPGGPTRATTLLSIWQPPNHPSEGRSATIGAALSLSPSRPVVDLGVPYTIPEDYHGVGSATRGKGRSEEHTSELQSRQYLVCRLLLEKKK